MTTKEFISLRSRAALVVGLSIFATASGFATISDAVKQQIAKIEAVKAGLAPQQKKLDSNLMFAALVSRGQLSPAILGTDGLAVPHNNPKILVDVTISGRPSASLKSYISSYGGTVKSTDARTGTILASVPIGKTDLIARHSDVKTMAYDLGCQVNRDYPLASSPGLTGVTKLVGALTSQGYVAHGVKVAAAHGYNGIGVKVGVLSDSATAARVSALIATGDLPGNTIVLPGQDGSATGANEGTAMMEIVHDLAPGAQLYFATAFTSAASFAANIRALAAAGCKVIVDDVSYYNEGVFQDGPIAQAVNDVTASGVSYFSSAANSGNKTDGTAGCWEGDFVNGGPVGGTIAGAGETGFVHSFGSSTSDVLTAASTTITLKWSDPLGASSNDYDLFVLNATGTTLLAFSAASQTGTQDPYEAVSKSAGFPAGSQLVVVKFKGSDRALHLDTNRGRLSISTPGVIYGHNGGQSTISVAASYWGSAHLGVTPFTGFANPVETFSSDGPRRVFYTPTGSALTPGNVLFGTGGGTVLAKPDITAADGVYCKTPGFLPFFGTSAAAPHAAALAALILQARPSYTPAQVKAALQASALDTMAVGWDRDSGTGIAMAWPAIQYAIAHP